MKRFRVSRGWLHVDTTIISAETKEQALEKAENIPDSYWRSCDGNEDINYQIEGEE